MGSAVAVGAAYYGRVRRGKGLRVKAGSARTYYIGTRSEGNAVCVLPAGTDEGTTLPLDREFSVLANRPVSFNLYSSRCVTTRTAPSLSWIRAQVHRHAPLVTLLRYGKKLQPMELAVRLSVSFTEVGTLELWCESVISPHRWRLAIRIAGQRDCRSDTPGRLATQAGIGSERFRRFPRTRLRAARAAIQAVFTRDWRRRSGDPASLVGELESGLGSEKRIMADGDAPSLLRCVAEVADGRKLSARHEARWLNLLGYCLRPGFGDRGTASA